MCKLAECLEDEVALAGGQRRHGAKPAAWTGRPPVPWILGHLELAMSILNGPHSGVAISSWPWVKIQIVPPVNINQSPLKID